MMQQNVFRSLFAGANFRWYHIVWCTVSGEEEEERNEFAFLKPSLLDLIDLALVVARLLYSKFVVGLDKTL